MPIEMSPLIIVLVAVVANFARVAHAVQKLELDSTAGSDLGVRDRVTELPA